MTNKEQITAYKSLRENGQVFIVDTYEDADRIISALEKQIPKKPNIDIGYDTEGNAWNSWLCPRCRESYLLDEEEYNYCPHCGQRIDWTGV